eukprot:COSAG02_NODE_190_length_30025_cov_22.989875_30_plen_231_part_00
MCGACRVCLVETSLALTDRLATCRAWLFNTLALGLVIGASFKAMRHYQKKRKGKTVQQHEGSVSYRQQITSGCADATTGADVAAEPLTELQTTADYVGGSPSPPDSAVPKQSQREQVLNESLPGQLESPERPPRVAVEPSVNLVPPFSERVATQGKLVLPPLRLSRKTGAAYYVDEEGKSVWASALPPPPASLLAADGSPWRDVYHTGPHNATHIDNLQREDKLLASEAP